MYVTAIIAAGGRGMGSVGEKQLVSIGGRTILERSVNAFLTHSSIDDLVVALPRELAERPPAYLTEAPKPLRIVVGGARRQDSVAAAFAAVPDRSDIVVVHDAARPFASADLMRDDRRGAERRARARYETRSSRPFAARMPPGGGRHA
jgi:2-C-methyl-D-erythritol 4-phosphate cytidylyltransferase